VVDKPIFLEKISLYIRENEAPYPLKGSRNNLTTTLENLTCT